MGALGRQRPKATRSEVVFAEEKFIAFVPVDILFSPVISARSALGRLSLPGDRVVERREPDLLDG